MLSIQSPYSVEALVIEVEQPFVYNSHTESSRNVSDVGIRRWLNSHGEVRSVRVNDLAELKASIDLYVGCRTALRLALYSVDNDWDESTRTQSASSLESLLENPKILSWLQDMFCLQALPEESRAIANSSLSYAKKHGLARYSTFLDIVLKGQPEIRAFSREWSLIEASSFFSNQHREVMDRALGTGIFSRIISLRAQTGYLELALLMLLKTRPNIGPEIEGKIRSIDIKLSNCLNILGLDDTMKGIEHFGLYALFENKESTAELPISFGFICPGLEKYSPSMFGLDRPIGRECVVVIDGKTGMSSPVSRRLYQGIESKLLRENIRREHSAIQSNSLGPFAAGVPPSFSNRNKDVFEVVETAMNKVGKWGSTVDFGVCQQIDSVGAISSTQRGIRVASHGKVHDSINPIGVGDYAKHASH